MTCFRFGLSLCLTLVLAGWTIAADDIVVADFEGKDYGDWKADGQAFGPGPARGTLPQQMPVGGFEGHQLVNSYNQGDGTTGTLTSAPFRIQRRYLNFLIGGGKYPGQTCINLLVDGKVVRTATGMNDQPGGSEALEWRAWDIADLSGQEAVLQIVDQATGGWGHINVDHILQSDSKRELEPAQREMVVAQRWLHLPVKNGARKVWMRFVVDGQFQREFDIELADGTPDFWTYTDIAPYQGRTLRIEVDRLREGSQGLAAIRQSDRLPDGDTIYSEPLRPQFHFSPRRGWTNDPNGMVYYQGEYHLFFQHNPYGVGWGNMTWGHAVSRDTIHWRELPDAIHPDSLGTIFSGSAVVDWNNTTGFQTGKEKPIVCIYTSAGGQSRSSASQPFTQSIAYSNDRGRTWTIYEKNPVLGHIIGGNRDPKVIWHEPTRQWVMALFLDGHDFALFASPNLKDWTKLCDLPAFGDAECPDFFELPVDGDPNQTRWVVWGANGNYLVGRFDGKTFTKESGPYPSQFGANDYAAQTYSDIPAADGRRIQISWMRGGKYPGMPFNQQMSIPRVLTLRTTSAGIRLFMEPVKELETLRGKEHAWKDLELQPEQNPLAGITGDLFDIVAEIELQGAKTVGFDLRGHKVEYSPADKQLKAFGRSAPLEPIDGRIRLRILVDRTSVEVFANDGQVQITSCFLSEAANKKLGVYATGASAKIVSLKVYELRSAWDMKSQKAVARPLYQPKGQRAWDFWFARSGDTYYAYYLQAPFGSHQSAVGLATSKDLFHWNEHGEVLRANPAGQWNDDHIATGSTWRCGDKWQMLFTARGKGNGLGLAESDDLTTWRKVGPVKLDYKSWTVPVDPYWQSRDLAAGETIEYRVLADPYVVPEPIDGWFYMIANCAIVGRPLNRRGCVNLMRSKDGLRWEDCGIIGLMLDLDRPETPQLWKHNDRWYLYVGGAREAKEKCRLNLLYTSRSMRGPFEPAPRMQLQLPDESRFFYIGKVLSDTEGRDVFLTCIQGSQLSRAYPIVYEADGSIRLERPNVVP